MRIVVHGQQAFGKAVLEALRQRGEEVVAVYVAPEKPGAKTDPLKETALAASLPVHQPDSYRKPEVWEQFRALKPDLQVMAFVTLFVPEEFLNIPTRGSIQYHPSLLPAYRGPSAINWPIIKGETETGLSIFWPDNGLDTGDILLQKKTTISATDTLGSVYFDRLFPMGVEAMLEAVDLVLVQRGSLRVGDSIVAGDAYGRVRRMVDEHGDDVTVATPSRPVQVIGLTSVPRAGDTFLVVEEDRVARQIAERRQARTRNAQNAAKRKRVSLEDLDAALKETSQLTLIIKGDNSGTVEALEDALMKIEVGDDVELRVIHRGVGGITEGDINLAVAGSAIVLGFNVRAEGKATELANREGVDVRYYTVIYQAIEEIEAALKGLLKPEFEEVEQGTAEIREVFRSSKIGNIAGCMVRSGLIRRNAKARVLRDGVVVGENVTVSSLKRFKDDATEVREGFECGLTLSGLGTPQVGDIIETFEMREKPRA